MPVLLCRRYIYFSNLLAFVLLLISASFTRAQKGLLWEITGNDLKKPAYLFGTMHVRDNRVFDFNDSLKYAIKSTDAFAGEIEINTNDIMASASAMMMPPDTTLEMLLSKKEYLSVKKYCNKNLGIFAFLIDKIKPIFTSALISESYLKADREMALDEYLQALAQKENKHVYGLESMQEQFNALNSFSLKQQAEMLAEQIKNIPEDKKNMEKMMRFYQDENLDSLLSFSESSLAADQKQEDALINDRNVRMTENIQAILKTESLFIAVGAAHLGGKKGIIALLQQKGYRFRKVKIK